MINISELNVYPVKSLQGISLQKAELSIRGLKYDRNWMVTDNNYNFITQRQLPAMVAIGTAFHENSLILTTEKISPIAINLAPVNSDIINTAVWKSHCEGMDEGDDVSKWLSEVLGKWNNTPMRLVRFANNFKRKVDSAYLKGEESHTAFADGFPYLITSEESLCALNMKLELNGAGRVPMNRFRPNIVIKGVQAFQENDFDALHAHSDTYSLGVRKPCQRCKITTVDQNTGHIKNPKEPQRTLLKMNAFTDLKGAYFGQNAILLKGEGEIVSVGDQLTAVKK